ncbi:MAG: PAS domain-containing protein [Bacteroidota bacterium]
MKDSLTSLPYESLLHNFDSPKRGLIEEAFSIAKIGIWKVDMITGEVYWSEEVYRIHEIAVGTPISLEEGIQFYRADFQPIVRAAIETSVQSGAPWEFECILVTAKGKERWVRSIGRAITEDGTLIKLRGIFQEIDQRKAQEAIIAEQQFRFRSIFGNTFNFIGLLEPDGTLLEANRSLLEFGGIELADVQGQKFYDAPWWSTSQAVREQIIESIQLAASGEFIRYEVEVVGAKGNLFIDFSITPILGEDGQVKYLVPDARDISERIELERSLQETLLQLKRFVTYAPAAVAMFDNQMRYLAASNKWVSDYQVDTDDLVGKSHYDIFPEILKNPAWLAIHQRVLAGETYQTDKDRFVRQDGSVQWLKYTLLPWYEDEDTIGGMLMYTADITSEVVFQEKLANLNQNLEMAVSQRTKALQTLNKEMEQFVYIASHDLQEPLRTIANYVQLLQENELSEEDAFFLSRIVQSTHRMQTLVKDLLDYSRVGGRESLTEIDLNELVKEVQFDLKACIERTGVQVVVEALPSVHASARDLRQLFQNLIGNALKYHRTDVSPRIRISVKEQEEEWVFCISDNGIGMEEKYLGQIFEIFRRLHSQEEYEGTGIGLAMCKKIIGNYEGTIWATSQPGVGSTFCFTFPTSMIILPPVS